MMGKSNLVVGGGYFESLVGYTVFNSVVYYRESLFPKN